ncbi:MAG: phosphotransferase [Proteobacteria bacterium]|nr:phosphotransferase [Pseudomonadota bacterium]
MSAIDTQIGHAARDWLERQRGVDVKACEEITGGAGARQYWRAHFADATRAVLMLATPEDPAILPPALRRESERLAFVEVTRYLAGQGLPVPEILAVRPERRWVLLEDLGRTHVCDLRGEARLGRLAEAARLLARVHALPECEALPFERRFDAEWVRFELATFARDARPEVDPGELDRALDELAEAVAALPPSLCLRDYHSQNLMVDPSGRLRIIDYQDALLAPAALDLAALLHDSYIELSDPQRRELLDEYRAAGGAEIDPRQLGLLVVQRKCKDFGRYRYLVERRGESRYAAYLARARDSVLTGLEDLPSHLGRTSNLLRRAVGSAPA